MLTNEEAILLSAYTGFLLVPDFSEVHKFCEDTLGRPIWTHDFADRIVQNEIREKLRPQIIELIQHPAALRGPTREMVERMRGEWIMKRRHHGGFRRVTGVDDMGERHTITIDERCEYDDRYCPKCGKQSPDNFLNFCGYCGAPMTDEAVDMMLRRWKEALHEKT